MILSEYGMPLSSNRSVCQIFDWYNDKRRRIFDTRFTQ
jgi:hypothetical protein